VPPRSYTSPRRQADAARTRAAIVDAAGALFSRQGYPATTMKAIAEEAGVSVQSVHLAGSKASLLIAAFERTFAGDEGEHSLSERPAMAEIMGRASADDAITGWLDYVSAANARTAGISRAMAVAAEVDPLAAEAVAHLDARRRRDLGLAAAWLHSRGIVATGDVEQATDELNHLMGPETFAFFAAAGWSFERYRSWLERSLRALITQWRP
jgi:AcrR family transcriptional regulator